MPLYTCPRCDYTNTHLTLFTKHLERKRPCQVKQDGRTPISPHDYAQELRNVKEAKKLHKCSTCNKMYSSKQSLRAHERRLHGLHVKAAATVPPNIFGVEDISHLFPDDLTCPDLVRILTATPHAPMSARFQDVIRFIFMDPTRPQNRTVYVMSDAIYISSPQGFVPAPDPSDVLHRAKRLAAMVMQHPLSQEERDLDIFKSQITHETYNELIEFTDELDKLLIDPDPELIRKTDELVWEALKQKI